MKVLLISPKSGIVGGIAIWTKNILLGLEDRREIEVQLNDFSREITGQMIKNPVKKYFFALKDYFRLTSIATSNIREFDGTKVHICSSASFLLLKDLFLIKACKRKRLESIIHFHFGRIPDLACCQNWEWKLIKLVCKQADKVIVMDKKSFDTLSESGFKNINLLPNPISDETKRLIEKIDITKKENSLLFAGHCIPTKGVFELIEACKNIPNIHLTMLGAITAEMKRTLISIAGEKYQQWLDIKGEVSYEDTLRYMKRASIFILPTYTEGFPNVILESMACRCCIIACSVGAIPEILEDEKLQHYGVLICPKSSVVLQEAIENTLSNQKMILECANNARKRVYERYNVQAICNKLVEIWEN